MVFRNIICKCFNLSALENPISAEHIAPITITRLTPNTAQMKYPPLLGLRANEPFLMHIHGSEAEFRAGC